MPTGGIRMISTYTYVYNATTKRVHIHQNGEHIATAVTAHPFTAAHTVVAKLNGGKAAHAATVRTRKQQARHDWIEAQS